MGSQSLWPHLPTEMLSPVLTLTVPPIRPLSPHLANLLITTLKHPVHTARLGIEGSRPSCPRVPSSDGERGECRR